MAFRENLEPTLTVHSNNPLTGVPRAGQPTLSGRVPPGILPDFFQGHREALAIVNSKQTKPAAA